jgi:hypothetical protein
MRAPIQAPEQQFDRDVQVLEHDMRSQPAGEQTLAPDFAGFEEAHMKARRNFPYQVHQRRTQL